MRFFLTTDARNERLSDEASRLLGGQPVRVIGFLNTGSRVSGFRTLHALLGFPADRIIACTDDTIGIFRRSYFGRVDEVAATYPIATTEVVLAQQVHYLKAEDIPYIGVDEVPFGEWTLKVGSQEWCFQEWAEATRVVEFCKRRRLEPDWNDMRPCLNCARESPKGRDACGWCGVELAQ